MIILEQTLTCLIELLKYLIICVIFLIVIHKLFDIPKFIFRKILHLVAFSCVTFSILTSESYLASSLSSIIIAIVIYPILTFAEKFSWYDNLLVQKSPGEIKRSMIMLFLTFAILVIISWEIFNEKNVCAAAIIMWGFGDAAAALIGIPFGKHKVKLKFTDGKKSYEGSFAMFITALICGSLFLIFYCQINIKAAIIAAILGSVVGTLTELFSPSEYDTITVPCFILFVLLLII